MMKLSEKLYWCGGVVKAPPQTNKGSGFSRKTHSPKAAPYAAIKNFGKV